MRQPLSVTAIIAAYNEEDVIGPVVTDLLEQGVRVHLLDHGSTDATLAEVERLRDRGPLTIERLPGGEFSLAQIIRRKEILAAELDSDWFVNADADEFRESPWPGVRFVDAIQEVDRLGYNAVDFAVLNFLPVDDRFRKGDDPRDVFRFCEPGGAFDRLQIRCWKKQPGPLDLASSAGHEARFPDRRVFPLRFLLRHYPIRGQAHGERKVLRERLPRFAADERAKGWHVQYDAFREGASFLRESSSLLPFDPWSTRVALALQHRGVESLEARLTERDRELESRERDVTGLGQDLEASRDAAATLRARTAELERELVATRSALVNQDAHVESLRRDREGMLESLGGLRAEREGLRVSHEQLRAELQRLQQAHEALRTDREQLLVARAVLEAQRDGLVESREALRVERDRVVAGSNEHAQALRAAQQVLEQREREQAALSEAHEAELAALRGRLGSVLGSRIWRATAPLRALLDRFSDG